MPVHALVAQCALSVLSAFRTQDSNLATRAMFWLFRMQNSQNNMWLHPWTPLGRGINHGPPQDSPAAQQLFSLLHSSKNQHPSSPFLKKKKKLLEKALQICYSN